MVVENRSSFWFWLIPPAVVGVAMRLFRLQQQVMGGDELHAVRLSVEKSLGEILTTFQLTDHSIPLTFLHGTLMNFGVQHSELTFRIPVLLAGVAVLVWAPWRFEREIGRRASFLLCWLLATSPLFVFYSRIARSYLPVVWLACIAVMAFYAWSTSRSRRTAAAYVLCSAFAVYLHLAAAPFVLAPFGFALIERYAKPRPDGVSLGSLLCLMASTAIAIGVLFFPLAGSLLGVIEAKRELSGITMDTLGGAAYLVVGSGSWVAVAFFGAFAAIGLGRLMRTRTRFALYAVNLAAAQLASLWVLSPFRIEEAAVFSRYLLVLFPFLLSWVAVGVLEFARLLGLAGRLDHAASTALSVGFVALLVGCGPFFDRELRASSFMHHNDHVDFRCPRAAGSQGEIPGFYRKLREENADDSIIEFPWSPIWRASRTPYFYQAYHGREVLGSAITKYLRSPKLGFRNLIRPNPDAFLASRARYVIVHRDLESEESNLEIAACAMRSELAEREFQDRHPTGRFIAPARQMLRRLNSEWGPPIYRDASIEVWDLELQRGKPRAIPK
jgi:hypothetical protein